MRIVVDMSVCILHHGHIRLLQKAKELGGHVIVALTTDHEVLKYKGYPAELSYEQRKEMLESVRFVDEVVPAPWLITDDFLLEHKADLLVHSGDNFNDVKKIVSFERTSGVSSTDIRKRALESIIIKRNTDKILMTGAGNIHCESLFDLRPMCMNGSDGEFETVRSGVLKRTRELTGHDTIADLPGSLTLALETAIANFISGTTAVVVTGQTSLKMLHMLRQMQCWKEHLTLLEISYSDITSVYKKLDWVVGCYVEAADGFRSNIGLLHDLARRSGAKLMMETSASINLEPDHNLADICAFDSSTALGGLTGASFLTFDADLLEQQYQRIGQWPLSLNINSYLQDAIRAPFHALCSLDSISKRYSHFRSRVWQSKAEFMERFKQFTCQDNQPLASTLVSNVTLQVPPGTLVQKHQTKPNAYVIWHLFDQYQSCREPGQLYEQLTLNSCN